jgi:hypothetical protein
MFVACESDEEAHYLCGALNSAPFRCFVAAYTIETQLSTHPMRYVHVPKFDGADPGHRALADASRAAHVDVAAGAEPDELAVDSAAAALWGLGAREVEAMHSFLDRLLKRAAE